MSNVFKRFITSAAAIFTALSLTVTSLAYGEPQDEAAVEVYEAQAVLSSQPDFNASKFYKHIELPPIYCDDDGNILSDNGYDLDIPISYEPSDGALSGYDFSNDFYYNQLSTSEKSLYSGFKEECESFYNSTSNLEEDHLNYIEYDISSISDDRSEFVFQVFRRENPKYFWLAGGTYYQSVVNKNTGEIVRRYLSPSVITDFESYSTRNRYKTTIESITEEWLTDLKKESTDLDKEILLAKKLADKITYDPGEWGNNNQTLAGALVDDLCVCSGYADAVNYFCNALGIDCTTVLSQTHSWNCVKLYGSWYMLDVTWADPDGHFSGKDSDNLISDMINKSYSSLLNYDNRTNQQGSHTLFSPLFTTEFDIPSCTKDYSETSETYHSVKLLNIGDYTSGSITVSVKDGLTFAEYLQSTTISVDPSGYTFAGWFSDAAGTKSYDINTTKITADITLYRKWVKSSSSDETTYTVTFNSNGGNSVSPQTIKSGGYVTKPDDPTRDGYRFTGWYTTSALTTLYNFNTPVTSNLRLHAGWEEITYTVTFVSNGTTISTSKVKSGATVSQPTKPTRTGYTFMGWYTTSDLTTKYDFSTAVTKDITLYARWLSEDSVEVVYSVPSKVDFRNRTSKDNVITWTTYSREYVNKNVPLSAPNIISYGASAIYMDGKTHYETLYAAGWYTSSQLTELYTFMQPIPDSALTTSILSDDNHKILYLYANWTDYKPWYYVHFLSNNGESVIQNMVTEGSKVTEPAEPTRDGYTFTGWYTDESCTKPYDFNTEVTSHTVLYAGWQSEKEPETFYVTYYVHSNSSGLWEHRYATVTEGSTAVNYAPERILDEQHENFVFDTWYIEDEYGNFGPYDFSLPVTKNISLFANIVAAEGYCEVDYYTVTDDAVKFVLYAVRKNAKASDIEPFARDGYTFTGWFTDEECTKLYDFNTAVTTDFVLYSGWKKNSSETTNYKVTVVDTMNNTRINLTVKSGEYVNLSGINLSHTGYTLEGWYTDEAYTKKFDPATTPITANITIYTKWKSTSSTTSYTVTLVDPASNNTIYLKVKSGEYADLSNIHLTNEGYTIEGWYTDKDLKNKFDAKKTPITSDITLYAKWVKKSAKPVVLRKYNNGSLQSEYELSSIEDALDKMKDTYVGGYFVITIDKDMSVSKLKLPNKYFTVVIDGQGHTITLNGIKSLSFACGLVLQDMTIVPKDSKGNIAPLTLTASTSALTLDTVTVDCSGKFTISATKGDLELIGVKHHALYMYIKGGSANSINMLDMDEEFIYSLTGFKNTTLYGSYIIHNALSTNNLSLYGYLGLKSYAKMTIKGQFEGITDDDTLSTIYVEKGFKPLNLNGSVTGTAAIGQTDLGFKNYVPLQKGQQIFKTKIGLDDIEKVFLANVDESLENWGFYSKSGKVTIADYTMELTFSDNDNTKMFADWNDMIKFISDRKASAVDYTVTLLGDTYINSALKFPTKGKYRSITIDGGEHTLSFKGTSASLTGTTVMNDITVKAVNSNGAAVNWKLKNSAMLSTDNATLTGCEKK